MLKRTNELQAGDLVTDHDHIWRLTTSSVGVIDSKRVYTWRTRLVDRPKNPCMPLDWAQHWIIQGSEDRLWTVVCQH